jgi:hypothetical protein
VSDTLVRLLPAGFEDLEGFVAEFSLPSERERYQKRLSLTLLELRVFYDAIMPRMDAVMDDLTEYPADDVPSLPEPIRNLYHLAQSYFEASHPIELKWKGIDLDDAFPQTRIVYIGPSATER